MVAAMGSLSLYNQKKNKTVDENSLSQDQTAVTALVSHWK